MAQEIAPGDYVSTTDWSTEYKGGYTPGWGPHVDAGAAAATALAERAAKKYGSIREAFLAVDTNGNGSVEKDELEEVLKLCSLPQETSAALLRQFDENGDEEWSYKEFVKALKRSDYVSYQRGSPSPTKMALAEGGPGHMPARATPVVPQRRGYNLFTGSELQQRESPPLRLSARYPAAVASGRRGRFPTGRSHLPAIPSPSPTRRRSEEPEPEPEPEPQAQPQSLLADGLPPSSVRGASDWSTEYRGGYTPGWGPHVDATAAAATALAQRAEQKFGSIREAFLSVDTNGNGYVERSELEAVLALCNLPPNTSASLLRAFDENGDAEWSYTEFVQALKRKDHSAYKRASPSPAKVSPDWMPEEEGQSTAAAMPPRASPVVPTKRDYNLFTGSELEERESPPLKLSSRYPAAVASGRLSRAEALANQSIHSTPLGLRLQKVAPRSQSVSPNFPPPRGNAASPQPGGKSKYPWMENPGILGPGPMQYPVDGREYPVQAQRDDTQPSTKERAFGVWGGR